MLAGKAYDGDELLKNVKSFEAAVQVRDAAEPLGTQLFIAANDPKDARAIHRHLTHASQGDCSPIMFAALVFRIANALKDLAQGDPDALAMLACWRDGVTVRGEVLARTQLTTAAYKATRKRLLTLRDKLPPELRDAAHDLLRSAS